MRFLLQISLRDEAGDLDPAIPEMSCHMNIRDDVTPEEFVAQIDAQSRTVIGHVMAGVADLLSARIMHNLKSLGQVAP